MKKITGIIMILICSGFLSSCRSYYIPPNWYDETLAYYEEGFAGGWKGMMIYNPSDNLENDTHELINMDIKVSGSSADLVIDWYWLSPGNKEGYNEENLDDKKVSGSISGGTINAADGNYKVKLDSFWMANGKEYAVGSIELTSDTSAYLALVR